MSFSYLPRILGIVAVYYITARLSQFLAIPPGFVSPVYPPSGIALALVLTWGLWTGWGIWWGQVLAAGLAFWFNTGLALPSLGAGLGIATGSTLQALAGGILIRRAIASSRLFDRSRDVFKFVGIEALCCAIAPTFGVLTMFACGLMAGEDAPINWITFWLGDLMGVLVVTPLVLTWCQFSKEKGEGRSLLELVIWFVMTIAVSVTVFGFGNPVEYLLIPVLAWAAFRFGQRGVSGAIAFVSALAILGTVRGTSTFNQGALNESLLLLQGFIGAISATTMVLSAVIIEREAARGELLQSNEALEAKVAERTAQLTASRDAAQVANRAKSEFLANMSHELRTPLNGILGYAQILRRSSQVPDSQKHQVDIIHQCGSHLLTLINDVLDLSKIEAQKMELMPVEFHLPSLVQGVVEICRIRAEQKGIEFRYEPPAILPEGVRGDDKRLRQVLLNLLSNAIKFTDEGCVSLIVSLYPIEAEKVRLRFEIIDTGVGMTPEEVERIFLPFEQVGAGKHHGEGTGLGLAISQKIVELMGDRIHIESEPHRGSTFWFEATFPVVRNWQTSVLVDRDRSIVGVKNAPIKILAIDDKWENRSILKSILEPIGFQVEEAIDGRDGLEKAAQFAPDLIITDLAMPNMDGFEAIARFRSDRNLKHIPILASSASVFEDDRYKCLDAGSDDFLSKPIEIKVLLQKLQKYLKLEWIYEPTEADSPFDRSDRDDAVPPTIAETDFVIPPPEEIERVYELAMKGNLKGIRQLAEEWQQTDRQWMPFARHLVQLAKEFKDREILDLAIQYRSEIHERS